MQVFVLVSLCIVERRHVMGQQDECRTLWQDEWSEISRIRRVEELYPTRTEIPSKRWKIMASEEEEKAYTPNARVCGYRFYDLVTEENDIGATRNREENATPWTLYGVAQEYEELDEYIKEANPALNPGDIVVVIPKACVIKLYGGELVLSPAQK